MWRPFSICLALLIAGAISPALAQDAKRVALIIGNSEYDTTGWDLANPTNDAALMATALESVDFEVTTVLNADQNAMEDAFQAHGERLAAAGPDAIGFFFYAGHGVQSEGLNYLIPTDLEAIAEADVWRAPRLETLFRHLRRAGNATNFIVMDACRNNPLLSSSRDISGGLASVARDEARGMLIGYATAPGAVAADGEGNSPYTLELAALLAEPGLSAEALFRNVATRVERQTEGRQQPWTESGLRGEADFCFAGCTSGSALDQETEDWIHISSDGYTGVDPCTKYANHLEAYPNGRFASVARHNLNSPACAGGDAIIEQDWLAATRVTRSGNNCRLYTQHIERFPDSPFRSRAEKLLGQAPCVTEPPAATPETAQANLRAIEADRRRQLIDQNILTPREGVQANIENVATDEEANQ